MQPVPQCHAIQHWSQNEQEGGFWLLNITVDNLPTPQQQKGEKLSPPPLAIEFGCQFRLENSDYPLFLFQKNQTKQQTTLQLLSKHPLPNTPPSHLNITPATPAYQAMVTTCQTANNVILLGSELHIANLFYLAKIRSQQPNSQTVALLHSETNFPFKAKPALLMAPNLPPEAIGTSTLLEDWNIPNRLASQQGLAGCFDGALEALFAYWLTEQYNDNRKPWQVIICASNETQKKCLNVSQSFDWIHCLGTHYDS
ncbi:MAG: hypothetical protein L3J01_00455 [Thiomicrorhabdus sp.]|nr:hypothetical protein [Thiomicrorhabdus sp.]